MSCFKNFCHRAFLVKMVTKLHKYEYNNIKYKFTVMRRLTLIIALIFLGLYLNAQEDNCNKISNEWKSEKDAISLVENTVFTFSELVSPDQNSWMSSAHYYSCDKEYGYLIVKSEKKIFIHQDVPVVVWNALKNANSIGGYYNFYIKNKYRLERKGEGTPTL